MVSSSHPLGETGAFMVRRSSAEPVNKKPFPRWLLIAGSIAVPVIGYIGARDGPANAFQEIAETAGFVKAPYIVTIQPTLADRRRFLVSIENPSLRSTQITGYRAEPNIQFAAALRVTKAEEDKPEPCSYARKVPLRNPLVIAPKSEEGLEVEPWLDECDFSIRVEGTTGLSNKALWIPETVRQFKAILDEDPQAYREYLASFDPILIEHLVKSGLPDPKTIPSRRRSSTQSSPRPTGGQTCPDGSVVPATDACPPPPPPPPTGG